MTKEQELKELNAFINKLGSSTYIGTWLRSCFPCVEQALKSDVCPSIYTMNAEEFQLHRDQMMNQTKERCKELTNAAEARSKQCEANAERIIQEARDAINKASSALNRF